MKFDFDSHRIILTPEMCKFMLFNKIGIKKTDSGYDWGGTENFRYHSKLYKDLKMSVEFHTRELKSTKRINGTERIFWILDNIKSYDDCPRCYCGKPANFISLGKGFSVGCCRNHTYYAKFVKKNPQTLQLNL